MKYMLMHKNTTVAEIELDDVSCTIFGIGEVYALEHVPIGVAVENRIVDRAVLSDW